MSIKSRLYGMIPGVRIILMHHLAEEADELCDCVIANENFELFVKEKRFISLENAVKNPSANAGAYCLTIDDGLADLYDIHRITQTMQIPITAFISSRMLDHPGYITTRQLQEMVKDPLVAVGSHGCTHIKLSGAADELSKEEIFSSKSELESLLKREVSFFAYSNGIATERDLDYVKQAGYKYAFGVVPRKHTALTKSIQPYLLPRYNLTNDTFAAI